MNNPRKTTHVLFLWPVEERLKLYIQQQCGDAPVTFLIPEHSEREEITELAPKADIIVGWRPDREVLELAESAGLFINPGIGVQHLLELFTGITENRHLTLVNSHGNSAMTAQHTVALLLSLTNRIILHHTWMKEGRWRTGDEDAATIPFRNRHVGFLGYGHVNQAVHRLVAGFENRYYALRRSGEAQSDNQFPLQKVYSPAELHEFLRFVDVLFVALPLTETTRGLIGKHELELLGPEGLLIHVGRGPVIDEHALFDALEKKEIAGAAIDVWYDYKADPDEQGLRYPWSYPFQDLDNAVLSPHRAASPFEDLNRWDDVCQNICRYAAGRTDFLNIVDLERGY